MRHVLRVMLPCILLASTAGCEPSDTPAGVSTQASSIVDAACGQCKFGLAGGGCELAVRVDGNAYFVTGPSIFDLGNPHAEDGMCLVVRRAQVTGEVVDDRYVASSFELLPNDQEKPKEGADGEAGG